MSDSQKPIAVKADAVPPRTKPSNYPEPFFSRMLKREKRQLGDVFGLKNFGVNLTRLMPGGESALLHRHSKQDEFIYILQGEPTLVTETAEIKLSPGMCAGFPAAGEAHQLVNRTSAGRALSRGRRPHAGRRGQLSEGRHPGGARRRRQVGLHPQGRTAVLTT